MAEPKAEGSGAKLSGLDALLIGLGRLALGQQPDKPAEVQSPVPAEPGAKSASAKPAPADLQAELPAVADAASQEFSGKLPGADEAARIAVRDVRRWGSQQVRSHRIAVKCPERVETSQASTKRSPKSLHWRPRNTMLDIIVRRSC